MGGEGPGEEQQLTTEHIKLAGAFLSASRDGDLPVLLDLLAPDVVRRVDRVLVPDHVATEVCGARTVAEETRMFGARARAGALALVDGVPGIVIAPTGRLEAVLRLGFHDGRIHSIDVIGDPRRLAGITLTLPPGAALPPRPRATADGRIGVMGTIAFEDLTPGTLIDLGEVKVDREEMLAFNQRFDPQPFHLDEDAAKRSVLGGLCASGWFTVCLWMRTYVDAVLADSTSQGSPGGRDLSWPAPVFPGDVLRMRLEVIGARLSRSRPGLGLVEMVGSALRGEDHVLRMTFTGMFGTRG